MKSKILMLMCMIPVIVLSQAQDTLKNNQSDATTMKTFFLGEVVIIAKNDEEKTNRISQVDMDKLDRVDVSHALNILPGVSFTASGPRNESMVSVRGFDLRAVPVYMDGIPVYVPYDGYVDLARFSTSDLSAIDVSKGFSSMLFGPNSLGGAINLISRKPTEKLEYDGALGLININGFRTHVNIGSNLGKFYIQGGYAYLDRKSQTMSADYKSHRHEDGNKRGNSYRTDQKANLKIGWTPNENNEYVLGYIYQHGKKGTPVYAGDDTLNSLYAKPRYWQWPNWDKQNLSFLSNTKWNDRHYIKSRLYYDVFKNNLGSYDDSTYTTQNKPYAFQSFYNDYTYGGSLEYGTQIIPKNELKLVFQYKDDIHRENNANEPVRHFIDNTITIGIEDVYKITDQFILIPGFSYNARKNRRAEDYNSATKEITDYANAGRSDAFNGQLGIFYYIQRDQKLSLSASRKTRFATIKDRYSYRMGTAIPNPDLKPETSYNLDLSYTGKFFDKLTVQTSVFYSHLKDGIISVSNVEPGKAQMQNIGNAAFAGLEMGLSYDISSKLKISGNYSFIHRKNISNPSILFTDVPKSKVFGYVQFQPIKALSILSSIEYNSERYSTSYGTKTPKYFLANMMVSGNVWKYMAVDTGVNNIFDKNYSLVEGYPEEGRNFFVTLRFFNH